MSLSPDDLVLYKNSTGDYMAGGFSVNSCLLNGVSNAQRGGSMQTAILAGLKNLAVPAGLLFLQQNIPQNYQIINNDKVIPDNLYDKLISLVSADDTNVSTANISNKRSTRKKITQKNNKTKRNNK